MRMRHRVAGTVLAMSLAAATVGGFAASLGGLAATGLGAGKAVVAACDTDGFDVSYTTSSGTVTAVTVSGIADPGCEGGQLALTLANTAGTSVGAGGPQAVPIDGDTTDNAMTVTLSPQPAAAVVTAIHVVVTGP